MRINKDIEISDIYKNCDCINKDKIATPRQCYSQAKTSRLYQINKLKNFSKLVLNLIKTLKIKTLD